MTKKHSTLFISMLALAAALTGCSGESFDETSVNKQTILVFYPWTGGTNSQGLKQMLANNVDSISQAIVSKGGLTNSRVMLFFSDSHEQSTLYELQYDESNRKVTQTAVKSYTGNSYCSAEGIADVLGEVKQRAEALNYALIIGAHGSGWTYSADWVNYPYMARKWGFDDSTTGTNKQSPKSGDNFSGIQYGIDPDHPSTRFFGSVSLADNAIDVPTLAEGIKQSGITMQYIAFDACYMGNVETAYELKDVTNYLIASSSEVMGVGIPYRSVWTYLNSATPNYSSIVSGVVNYYKSTDTPYCNMAAIDCRQMDNLASVMKQINSQYTLASTVPLDSIQRLGGFTPTLFYDMTSYVDSLCPSSYLKDQYTSQMKLTVKAAAHTDEAITYVGSQRGKTFAVNTYCGLSISDPSLHSVATKGREKTGWWKATH